MFQRIFKIFCIPYCLLFSINVIMIAIIIDKYIFCVKKIYSGIYINIGMFRHMFVVIILRIIFLDHTLPIFSFNFTKNELRILK